jgi:hypothetical protein
MSTMQLNQEELHEGLFKLVQLIEECGGSPALTNAVVLASDLRQAVGNQYNPPNPYAGDRVRKILGTDKTAYDPDDDLDEPLGKPNQCALDDESCQSCQ